MKLRFSSEREFPPILWYLKDTGEWFGDGVDWDLCIIDTVFGLLNTLGLSLRLPVTGADWR